MTKLWQGLVLAALFTSLALTQSNDDRYVIKRDGTFFQGSCRSGQVGMAPTSGQTYVCVSGQWRRNDLPACTPSAPSGTCDQMSMCLHRPTMILYGCSATNVWTAITGGGGGTPTPSEGEFNYSQTFGASTTVVLSHNLGTPNVLVSCYDSGDIQVLPDSVTVGAADPWDVVVTFATAQAGRCVVNGSGNGTTVPGGGGGTSGYTDLREDGAARVNDAAYIDFLAGFDVTATGAVSLDYTEDPVNLGSSDVAGTLSVARGGTGSTSFTSNTCLRYNGTAIVSAATDCGSGGGGAGCTDVDNDCLADNAENLTCTTGCVTLNVETTGQLGVAQGGTGVGAAGDDSVLVGSGSAWAPKTLPSCSNSVTSKLLYDNGTNTFSCGTDQTSGSGSTPQGPEGAIQFYEGGALGSNATLLWTEATTVLKAPYIEASSMFRGQGAFARFDIDRDATYDAELGMATPGSSYYLGFRDVGSYISWRGLGYPALRVNTGYFWYDMDGDATKEAADFCHRENGIDSNCDDQVDFNPLGTEDSLLVGNAGSTFIQLALPDCDGSGQALNYNTTGTPGAFSCQTISAGSSGLANKLDLGLDGTNVQVAVTGTVVNYDPDSDGTLEARLNADGSFETFGSADESGGMSSDGKLLFTADANNNGTGEGIDADPDGDGTYEWAMAATGTLTAVTGALIPGVCASTTPATTTTINDCNSATFTATGVTITTINTCNAANLGRQITLMCNSSGQTIGTGGNLKPAGGASFACAADDTWTAICDGTNWREVARSAN